MIALERVQEAEDRLSVVLRPADRMDNGELIYFTQKVMDYAEVKCPHLLRVGSLGRQRWWRAQS